MRGVLRPRAGVGYSRSTDVGLCDIARTTLPVREGAGNRLGTHTGWTSTQHAVASAQGTILREHEPAPPVVESIRRSPITVGPADDELPRQGDRGVELSSAPSTRSVDVMSTADRPGDPLKTEGQLDDPFRLEADQPTAETTPQ